MCAGPYQKGIGLMAVSSPGGRQRPPASGRRRAGKPQRQVAGAAGRSSEALPCGNPKKTRVLGEGLIAAQDRVPSPTLRMHRFRTSHPWVHCVATRRRSMAAKHTRLHVFGRLQRKELMVQKAPWDSQGAYQPGVKLS